MAYETPSGYVLRQGDVLTDVRTFSLTEFEDESKPRGSIREFGYSVIVTQDCDLEQDYATRFPDGDRLVSSDKLLFGVLLCGAYDETDLKTGQHRPKAQNFSSKEWKSVRQNKEPRYQNLGFVPEAGKRLVADFKDYFMVPCDFLYKELESGRVRRLAEMQSPYREHLLQRFCWYLMRVGLPTDFDKLPESHNEIRQ